MFSEENIEEHLCVHHLGVGKDFLKQDTKSTNHESKLDKLDYIKILT